MKTQEQLLALHQQQMADKYRNALLKEMAVQYELGESIPEVKIHGGFPLHIVTRKETEEFLRLEDILKKHDVLYYSDLINVGPTK